MDLFETGAWWAGGRVYRMEIPREFTECWILAVVLALYELGGEEGAPSGQGWLRCMGVQGGVNGARP